jgi:hypothetical protein
MGTNALSPSFAADGPMIFLLILNGFVSLKEFNYIHKLSLNTEAQSRIGLQNPAL